MTKGTRLARAGRMLVITLGVGAALSVAVPKPRVQARAEAEPAAPPGRVLAQFTENGPIHAKLRSIEFEPGDTALVSLLLVNRTAIAFEDVSGEMDYDAGAGPQTYCCIVPAGLTSEIGELEPSAEVVVEFEITDALAGPISFTTRFEARAIEPAETPTPTPTSEPSESVTPTPSDTPDASETPTPTETTAPLRGAAAVLGAGVRAPHGRPLQSTATNTPGPLPAGNTTFTGPLVVDDWLVAESGQNTVLTVRATNRSNQWLGGVTGELRLRGNSQTEVHCCLAAVPALVGPGEQVTLTSTFTVRLTGVAPSFEARFFGAVTLAPTPTPTLTPTITPTSTDTPTPSVTPTPIESPTLGARARYNGARPDKGAGPRQGVIRPLGQVSGPVLLAVDSWTATFAGSSTRIVAQVSNRSANQLVGLLSEITLRVGADAATDCCFVPDPEDLAANSFTTFSGDLPFLSRSGPMTLTLLITGAPAVPSATPTPTITPTPSVTSTPPIPGTVDPTTSATPTATSNSTAATPTETPGSHTPTPGTTTPIATVSATTTREVTPVPSVPPSGVYAIFLARTLQK